MVPPHVSPTAKASSSLAECGDATGATGDDVERLGDDRALDAAARHRADDLAVLVHGHRRARLAWARSLDVDHPCDRGSLALLPPPLEIVQQLTHAILPLFARGSSRADHVGEVFEARDGVTFDELVDVRQRRGHTAR